MWLTIPERFPDFRVLGGSDPFIQRSSSRLADQSSGIGYLGLPNEQLHQEAVTWNRPFLLPR